MLMSVKLTQSYHTPGHCTFWVSLSPSTITTYTRRPQGVNLYQLLLAFTCPQIFIIIITILKEKGVMQTWKRLAKVEPQKFHKMLQLHVCKPIRLHNSFLLKYNSK